ncbi:Mor transcription activator family protein [Stenotrophomonas maltophilia]|nr:Mor transcription activator family protein [Stenotrophomonas maltophilia]
MRDSNPKTHIRHKEGGVTLSGRCQTPATAIGAASGRPQGQYRAGDVFVASPHEGAGVLDSLGGAVELALRSLHAEVHIPTVVQAVVQRIAREYGGVNLCFPATAEGAGRRSDTKARRDGFMQCLKEEVIAQLAKLGCDQARRESAGGAAMAAVATTFSGGSVYIPSMAAARQAEQHVAIVARYRAGERTHDIAANFGISERSVRRILQRTRERNRRSANSRASAD